MADEKKEVVKKTAETKKPKKDGNVFSRAWKRIKKFFKDEKGECKKVVWPSAKTVVKSSLVVLAVVAVTTIVIYGIDQGLSALIQLLVGLAKGSKETTEAAAEATSGMIRAFFGF
ncbi:MAG: preprotein translocase subunit SecE [Clostridia bacterium]|nr:preprotein translocase subunit SecE [Clostridia bacterium]